MEDMKMYGEDNTFMAQQLWNDLLELFRHPEIENMSFQAQERMFEKLLKEIGLWADIIEMKKLPFIGHGAEAQVYKWSECKGKVVKIMDPSFRGENVSVYLENMELFNALFPEAKLTFRGGCRDEQGALRTIFSQQFIKGEIPTYAQIKEDLQKHGFQCDDDAPRGGVYVNDKYLITDVHPRNAFITNDGKFNYFDVIVEDIKEYE
jgi:virulence-associated protein VapD